VICLASVFNGLLFTSPGNMQPLQVTDSSRKALALHGGAGARYGVEECAARNGELPMYTDCAVSFFSVIARMYEW
jgi:hypothetical protein